MAGGALRQAEHALNFAQVVVLMVDAAVSTQLGAGLTRRELALASSIVREGRALIIALNKLDLLSPLDRDKVRRDRHTSPFVASSNAACCCLHILNVGLYHVSYRINVLSCHEDHSSCVAG